jgi:hypothetical protein
MIRRCLFTSILGLVVVLPICVQPSAAEKSLDAISLCDIRSSGQSLLSRKVAIQGIVVNSMHFFGLQDNYCPDVSVRIQMPSGRWDKSIGELDDLVAGRDPSKIMGKRIMCICVGTVEPRDAFDILHLEKVEKVWVSDQPMPDMRRSKH